MISVKLSKSSVEYLRDLITGDKKLTPYLSGPKLVDFFNEIGVAGYYGRGFPSRWAYAEEKLNEINGTTSMTKAILKCFDSRRFIDTEFDCEAQVRKFNQFLKYDGLEIKELGGLLSVVSNNPNLNLSEEIRQIDNSFVQEALEKSAQKISTGDFSGAITNARSMLESVLRYLYREKTGKDIRYDGDMLSLYKEIQGLYDLFPQAATEGGIRQVLQGMASAVNGIAVIRNNVGDSHGQISEDFRPTIIEATLVVNASRTVSSYLIELHNLKK